MKQDKIESIDAAGPASFTWSRTALGEPALWPFSLRLTVDIMLNSPLASVLMWGPEHVMVFNDAYVGMFGPQQFPVPGGTVPARPPAAWSWNAAAVELAWGGKVSSYTNQALPVGREGAALHQALDLFYTPICDEQSQVLGVLCSMAASAGQRQAGASGVRPLDILVVEDNVDTRYLVCEMLSSFGHQAQGAGNGEDALDILATSHFDVLFTDISLPGISGVDLARDAVRFQPGLNIVFASGFGNALTKHVGFPATFLQKPYNMEQLQEALDDINIRLSSGCA